MPSSTGVCDWNFTVEPVSPGAGTLVVSADGLPDAKVDFVVNDSMKGER